MVTEFIFGSKYGLCRTLFEKSTVVMVSAKLWCRCNSWSDEFPHISEATGRTVFLYGSNVENIQVSIRYNETFFENQLLPQKRQKLYVRDYVIKISECLFQLQLKMFAHRLLWFSLHKFLFVLMKHFSVK